MPVHFAEEPAPPPSAFAAEAYPTHPHHSRHHRRLLYLLNQSKAQKWLPPLSFPTLVGFALVFFYIGHPALNHLNHAANHSRNGYGGRSVYNRAADLAACQALPPIDPCFASNNSGSSTALDQHSQPVKRTLYMQPYGALGSRLRGTASGLTIAQEMGAQPVIVWQEKEFGYTGGWHELFSEPKLPLGCFPGQTFYPEYAKCTVHIVNNAKELEAVKTKWEKIKIGSTNSNEQVLCLKSVMYLTPSQRGIAWFYSLLVPAQKLLDKAEAFKKEVGWNRDRCIVGVHIRRTDLKLKCNTEDCTDGLTVQEALPLTKYLDIMKSIMLLRINTSSQTNSTPTLERFIGASTINASKIQSQIQQNSNVPVFYLATDDPEAEQLLKQGLSDLATALFHTTTNTTQTSNNSSIAEEENSSYVISFKKATRDTAGNWLAMRSVVSGIEEAVIDLYLLSRASMVIGTVGSTFSQTARLMGGRVGKGSGEGGVFYVTVGAEFENAL